MHHKVPDSDRHERWDTTTLLQACYTLFLPFCYGAERCGPDGMVPVLRASGTETDCFAVAGCAITLQNRRAASQGTP
jgi:hypothetical protein